MARKNWSDAQLRQIWQSSCGMNNVCVDPANRTMVFKEYGNIHSNNCWNVDHINADEYNDSMANLQPLHCKSNSEKGNKACPRGTKCW